MAWQRHYGYLTQLLAEGTRLSAVLLGVGRRGEDISRWLTTQRRDFRRLRQEQQRRLAELGVKPARGVQARTAATAKRHRPAPASAASDRLDGRRPACDGSGRLQGIGHTSGPLACSNA